VAISTISFISYKAINYIYNNNKIATLLFKITYNYHYYLAILQHTFYTKKPQVPEIMNRKEEKVSYVLMLVEYTTLDLSISIKIPKQDYYVSNKILSQEYIKKYLHDINIQIDTEYTVMVMDEDLNTTYLDKNSCILFKKDTYYKINYV
jgi:hypothetical protein